jgi:hypothetical protein
MGQSENRDIQIAVFKVTYSLRGNQVALALSVSKGGFLALYKTE